MALAVGLTAVLGFLLGTFFPAGLRLLGTEQGGDDVALAWATNGLFSVAGSVLAMAVAIAVGFNWVWVAGSAGYLVVAGLVWGPLRQRA
jgi:hypothetical protein